jgi:hypothetical protein
MKTIQHAPFFNASKPTTYHIYGGMRLRGNCLNQER